MLNYKDEIYTEFNEEDFDRIQEELRNYLGKKQPGSLLSYILDFCDVYSYRIEDVAEVISTSKELKELIRMDCIFHKILRTEDNCESDEW